MRLAVIGAGRLGTALGRTLAAAGHEVTFGGGESAHRAAAKIGANGANNREAVAGADIVVLTVPFAKLEDAIAQCGDLDGQIVWSCVNALKPDISGLEIGFDTSAAEKVANHALGARVVEAIPPFADALAAGDVRIDGRAPSVFLCADDDEAKQLVSGLVSQLGGDPVDAGPLVAARLVEPAMMLLVRLAYGTGTVRRVGLALLEC